MTLEICCFGETDFNALRDRRLNYIHFPVDEYHEESLVFLCFFDTDFNAARCTWLQFVFGVPGHVISFYFCVSDYRKDSVSLVESE